MVIVPYNMPPSELKALFNSVNGQLRGARGERRERERLRRGDRNAVSWRRVDVGSEYDVLPSNVECVQLGEKCQRQR